MRGPEENCNLVQIKVTHLLLSGLEIAGNDMFTRLCLCTELGLLSFEILCLYMCLR